MDTSEKCSRLLSRHTVHIRRSCLEKQWWGPSIVNMKESVEGPIQKGTLRKNPPPIFLSYCKQKYNNKKYLLILCCFHSKDYPRS